jgi:arylsulfatase A-like enzyme
MHTRRFPITVLLSALALILSTIGPVPCQEPTSIRPNILVLMAEDLSPRIGAFGDPVARTPNIDRLAASGVRFPNTFTTAGVCAPSRAALITGMHAISIGAQHMRSSNFPGGGYTAVPRPEVKAFPELLRAASYYTYTNFKLDYQFSEVFAGTGPFTIWDADDREAHFRGRPAGRPFFGLVNFFVTHESATFSANETAARARTGLKKPVLPEDVSVPPYYPDLPEIRSDIATVYNNVQVMDAEVGVILDQLEADGLLDDTIVIWTTDHGDPLPRSKREIYDSGIKVPMIIRWPASMRPPGFEPGRIDERLVSFVDLAPMILSMAGVPAPAHLHGRDVLDPALPPRRYIFAAGDRMDVRDDRVRAVRDRDFKYIRCYRAGTAGAHHIPYRDAQASMRALWAARAAGTLDAIQSIWFEPRPEESLYDLRDDPYEVDNLVGDPAHAKTLERMRAAYRDWQARVPDLSEMPEAELAQRMWPGGVQPVTEPPSIKASKNGLLVITASTPGSSIGYRIGDGPWLLYHEPIALEPGTRVTAKAVRYGFTESAEVVHPTVTAE